MDIACCVAVLLGVIDLSIKGSHRADAVPQSGLRNREAMHITVPSVCDPDVPGPVINHLSSKHSGNIGV